MHPPNERDGGWPCGSVFWEVGDIQLPEFFPVVFIHFHAPSIESQVLIYSLGTSCVCRSTCEGGTLRHSMRTDAHLEAATRPVHLSLCSSSCYSWMGSFFQMELQQKSSSSGELIMSWILYSDSGLLIPFSSLNCFTDLDCFIRKVERGRARRSDSDLLLFHSDCHGRLSEVDAEVLLSEMRTDTICGFHFCLASFFYLAKYIQHKICHFNHF